MLRRVPRVRSGGCCWSQGVATGRAGVPRPGLPGAGWLSVQEKDPGASPPGPVMEAVLDDQPDAGQLRERRGPCSCCNDHRGSPLPG